VSRGPDPHRRDAPRKLLPHARPGASSAADLEIRHHLEERVERLIEQGWDPDEARREAERRLGDVGHLKSELRSIDRRTASRRTVAALVDGFAHDLLYAVRGARRTPRFTLAVGITLGLGIGANTAIFTVIEAVLLRPLPFDEPDRIAYVQEVTPWGQDFAVAPANYLDWAERQSSFESMAVVASGSALVTEGGDPERVAGVRVSGDYFRVLGIDPTLGRTFTPAEQRPGAAEVVVLSHGFWTTRLGADPRVLGQTVRLDGTPHTVVGVMAPGLRVYATPASTVPVAVWRPNPFANDVRTERAIRRLIVIGRLAEGGSIARADAEMKTIAAELAAEYPEANEGMSAVVHSLPELMTRSARRPLLILLGAVGFVLLIACLNVGNLLLARADARRTDVTLRRAMGASRFRIVRQLLAESTILSLAGTVFGLALARVLLPVLLAASPVDFLRLAEVGLNGRVFLFAMALAGVTALLTGLAPALGLSSLDLVEALKEQGFGKTDSRRRRTGKSALVVGEIALSVVLVIGAGLMLGSYLRITSLDLGFDPDDVLSVSAQLPRARYADAVGAGTTEGTRNFTRWRVRPAELEFMDEVTESLLRLPGVESVAAGNFVPMPGMVWGSTIRTAEALPPTDLRDAEWALMRAVSPDWFRTLSIPIVQGRAFTSDEARGGEDVVVIDESVADSLFAGQTPLGRHVILRDGEEDAERPFRVVGVSGEARQGIFLQGRVFDERAMTVYIPYRRQADTYADWQVAFRMNAAFVVRTERDLADMAPSLREAVWAADPELPVRVERAVDLVSEPLASRRFYMATLMVFGGLAMLLAASGVFAVMAYSVSRKTQELGIRKALGARAAELERAELVRGLRLAAFGIVLGMAGAVALTRFIESLLYGVSPTSPLVFASAAVLLAAVAVVAAYVPARQASRVDPVQSLRIE
jgi:predicted permease